MRIALLGSGWVMNLHAAGEAEHPRGELVAVANWREESARALAQRFGIPRGDRVADGILEGREPRPNGEDGRVVMRIVEEAYASAGWSG